MRAVYGWVTMRGEGGSGAEGVAYLEREELDAVFLDVQMRDGDGFSVLSSLPTPAPKIIFTTAYSAFAIRAFEVNALDYLLKPIAPDRLATAMTKLKEPGKASNVMITLQPNHTISLQHGPPLCFF